MMGGNRGGMGANQGNWAAGRDFLRQGDSFQRMAAEHNRLVRQQEAERKARRLASQSSETSLQRKESLESDDETKAQAKLKLAKMLAEDGLNEHAREQYREILATYPKTSAAKQAKELLAKKA